jgi:uncharacterized membrane protein HdeD (DUF308 family)
MREESTPAAPPEWVQRLFFRRHATTRRNTMHQLMSNFRTMFLFRGIVAILFGLLTLVWPGLSLTILVLLFGIFVVTRGITALVAALSNRGEQGWGVHLCEGMVGILVGAVALIWPGITALAFLYLLAAWAIMTGILELLALLALPMSSGHRVLMALIAVVSVAFGVFIAVQPASGLLAVAWLIGIYAMVVGTLHLVVYFVSRSLASRLARQASV